MSWRKQGDSGDALVKAAKAYIEAHSMEKFSLKKLSGTLYINGSYLLRQFKSHTGQTLLEYHNHVRCEKAKALLRETEMSVSEIGMAVGFVSSAHFSHVFRKMTGRTPTAYRDEK
ncbi:MAG: helix-turn-helix transcriptional regulator [Clostridia bacterium]|nr:helix-turn-helix transcriptional regulator [Clostridia bacterium]